MRILNIVNTPFEFYYLTAAGYLIKRKNPEITLRLLTRQYVLNRVNPALTGLYSDIQTLDFPYILQNLGIRTFARELFHDLLSSIRFKRGLNAIDLSADVVCISSFREYFANIILTYFKDAQRMIAFRMCDHGCDHVCNKKKGLRQAYLNILNRLFGLSTMQYRWHPDTASVTWACWFDKYPYDRTVCISDWGHGISGTEYRLSPPFTALSEVSGYKEKRTQKDKPAILVAGERTPLFEGWNDNDQALYDEMFDFIRKNFSDCDLFFKPRGGLTDINKVPVEGFQIIDPDIPFEELCLKNRYKRVIAVKSTACKVAAYYGQPAYALYPMFDLPDNLRKTLDSYMSDMHGVIKIHELKGLLAAPPSYAFDIDDMSASYADAIIGL